MEISRRRELGQNAAEGEVRGIYLDGEGQVRLEVTEDGGRGESLLEGSEGCSCRHRPGKLDSFAGKGSGANFATSSAAKT